MATSEADRKKILEYERKRKQNQEDLNVKKKAENDFLKTGLSFLGMTKKEYTAIRVEEEKASKASKTRVSNTKKSLNLTKGANKLAKSSKSILLEQLGIKAKDLSIVEKINKERAKGDQADQRTISGFNAVEELRQEAISALEEGSFVFEEFESKVKDLQREFGDIENFEEFTENFKDSFGAAKEDAEGISKALGANIPFLDKIDNLKQKAEDFSAILSSGPTMALAAAGLLLKVVTDFVMQAKEARQELGITAGSALALSVDMETAAKAGTMFGGDAEKASASVRALAESMGRVPKLSQTSAFEFGRIASLSGASAESLATIVELQALSQGISQDKAIDDLASLEALAESEGVLKSQVFDDVANAAKDQALFFGKSAEEIGKAAVEMRKLGIEASALNSLAESLLDLESSISSEFELQLLFGKNINLNKAREAAFNRDSAGLAKEIRMQLGGQFDLASANAAQVKALTDAFGLTQEQLQKVIQGQDIFNNKAKEAPGIFDALKANAMTIGMILGGLVGLLISMKGVASFGATLAGDIATVAAGTAIGVGAGAGVVKLGQMAFEDAHIERKSVGSMEPAATFALGDAASINVSKSTQDAINLEMDKLVSVIREELVAEVKSGNKDNKETLSKVISATEDNTRAVRKIM